MVLYIFGSFFLGCYTDPDRTVPDREVDLSVFSVNYPENLRTMNIAGRESISVKEEYHHQKDLDAIREKRMEELDKEGAATVITNKLYFAFRRKMIA